MALYFEAIHRSWQQYLDLKETFWVRYMSKTRHSSRAFVRLEFRLSKDLVNLQIPSLDLKATAGTTRIHDGPIRDSADRCANILFFSEVLFGEARDD